MSPRSSANHSEQRRPVKPAKIGIGAKAGESSSAIASRSSTDSNVGTSRPLRFRVGNEAGGVFVQQLRPHRVMENLPQCFRDRPGGTLREPFPPRKTRPAFGASRAQRSASVRNGRTRGEYRLASSESAPSVHILATDRPKRSSKYAMGDRRTAAIRPRQRCRQGMTWRRTHLRPAPTPSALIWRGVDRLPRRSATSS